MTCEQAIEILPWYLNGTLEATEREEVRHHLATCEACRQALAENREAWRIFDQHLPSEALVALAWEDTPAGIDPALAERHLAACSQCTAELELARTSRHLEEDERIALFPMVKPAAAPARQTRGDGEYRTWRKAALAASLAAAVTVAAGSFFYARQADRGTEQANRGDELAVNTPILQLYSTSEIVRGEEEDAGLLPVGSLASLILTPEAGAERYETYEVEIRGPGGDLVLQKRDLVLKETGDFSLTLRSGFPRPGRYTIQVFGLRDGRRGKRVGVYQVTAR